MPHTPHASQMPHAPQAPREPFQRDLFHYPEGIYLDGNSLGLMPKATEKAVQNMLEQWRQQGVAGWDHWFDFAERLSPSLAKLVGAHSEEVIATGSITSNLHALLATFYRPDSRPDGQHNQNNQSSQKRHLLATALDFPSDLYAMQSWAEREGAELRLVPSRDGHTLHPDDLADALQPDIALALFPSVLYRSGQLLPMKELTALAQQRGIVIGWDAAHSVGCIPHHFHDIGADFAVWCHYKYVNAGPGAPAGLFVHQKHAKRLPALRGWWGHDKSTQFEMQPNFRPATSAGVYQWGTPPLLGLAALAGALSVFDQLELDDIRKRSLTLTTHLIELAQKHLPEMQIVTPLQQEQRGGHVSLQHPQAKALSLTLRQHDIVPDFREPNILRLAPVALYNTENELTETVQLIRRLLDHPAQLSVPATGGVS